MEGIRRIRLETARCSRGNFTRENRAEWFGATVRATREAALCIFGGPVHATAMPAVSAAGNPWVPSTPRQMRILAGNKPGSGYQGSFRGLYRTAYNFWNLLSTPEVGMTKAAEADRNRQSQE